MDIQEIQTRLSALNGKLLDRGFTRPECELHVCSDVFWVKLDAKHPENKPGGSFFEYCSGDTPEEAFAAAEIKHIPSLKEKMKQDFVKSLGKLIDTGREIGIDVDFINPLEKSMRQLSENILEHSAVQS